MTEHKHEWVVLGDTYYGGYVACVGCQEDMTNNEAERRLNVHDKLVELAARLLYYNDGFGLENKREEAWEKRKDEYREKALKLAKGEAE